MRRVVLPVLVLGAGLLLLADFLIVNPSLGAVAGLLTEGLVLLAGAAALAGALALAARHGGNLWRRRDDPVASVVVLAGMTAVLVAGLRPGATGADDPAVRWLVAALVVPLAASLFGLLFVFTLAAARRSMALRSREASVMLTAAAVVLVLLLPLGGPLGDGLAAAAGWTLSVPVAGVFRGLLIGVALVSALVAARSLLGIDAADE